MTIQTVREFINRHSPAAAGLAALAAALDAKIGGAPLEPALATRIHELLSALGAGDLVDDLGAAEARPLLNELRHQLGFNGHLMYRQTRTTSFTCSDPQLLQEVGDFARAHAQGISRNLVPALDGLAERFGAPGAAFLDVGVGVAGLAIGLAQDWPGLRIVGIDVSQPALALARQNVALAELGDRIDLREQAVEHLTDEQAFDLAWMPIPFIPERIIPAATERILRALRPGGWVVFNFANFGAMEPAMAAMWRLRTTTWGGPLWTTSDVEKLLRETGFADVRTLPSPPGSPVALVAGRRAERR
jgi:predicted O-methyltransferase YrrM